MAQEIKNTFLKAKMNKDLDDRIIPNGEYRDALNVSVGRSEADNVGAVENIIGNSLITQTDLGPIEIIGQLVDSSNDRVFVFLTDYSDPNPENPTDAPFGTQHYIYVFNTSSGNYTRLVKGEFLNFSTTNRITGINLIESLLFWTDDRNQPRKININLASTIVQSGRSSSTDEDTDYYTEEHQISVAKYSPYQPINLVNKLRVVASGGAASYITVEGNRVEELEPFIGGILVSPEDNLSGEDYLVIVSVAFVAGKTRISFEPDIPGGNSPTPGSYYTLFASTMTNKKDDSSWPGDPDYLEDKFVRFSYRFKYDDNEYSLMAPFTQVAYIPKQKGYFVHGQEDAAYRSTVLDWFENDVQNIELNIPLPCPGDRLNSHYKVSEMEILFRESDSVAVKVLESVSASEINSFSGNNNIYTYDYQSRKPYRTLAEAQTVRVYDKVPVRAQSQEVSGNRVIYGNYRDQHTPPTALNYNCRINRKLETGKYNNFVEYPTHTVKRNRNYQIGFVLSDKFGRTSPVILSNVDLGTTKGDKFFSGSTIYSPYDSGPDDTPNILEWFGDTIQVLVNEAISSTKNLSAGTPGLYAIENKRDTSGEGYAVLPDGILINGNVYQFRWDSNYLNNKNLPAENDYLRGQFEDFVEVKSIEEIDPTLNLYQVITDGQVNESYLREENLPSNSPDLKFSYRLNDLGWYSYKIVVKQTQQEYYNVYLPGILNGYPGQSYKWTELSKDEVDADDNPIVVGDFKLTLSGYKFPNELDVTAHTVLFNDNINKIPRDLAEVGPDQKQYRSSVVLYGRVTNIMTPAYGPTWGEPGTSYDLGREHLSKPQNTQYYPRTIASGVNAVKHVATQVGNARDMQMGLDDLSPSALKLPIVGLYGEDSGGEGGQDVFYSLDSNPLIAKISTEDKSIGWPNTRPPYDFQNWNPDDEDLPEPPEFLFPQNMLPGLAVYETEPVESNLDIYWETSSTGLIVDLNADINGFAGAALALDGYSWDFDEGMTKGDAVTTPFRPIDSEGNPYVVTPDVQITSVTKNVNGVTVDATTMFKIQPSAQSGFFEILFDQNNIQFVENSYNNDVYTFNLSVETDEGFLSEITIQGEPGGDGALANIKPFFDNFTPANNGVAQWELSSSESIIIESNEWTGVTNGAHPNVNGGAPYENGLVYSFVMRNPNESIPGEDNGNWEMNPSNGELKCEAGETANGVYQITLILTDASGDTQGNGNFTALTHTQDMDVIVGYPTVNPGVLTTQGEWCLLNAFNGGSPQPAPTLIAYNRALSTIPVNNQGNGNVSNGNDGIWYISKDPQGDFLLPGVIASNPLTELPNNLFSNKIFGGNTTIHRLGPNNPSTSDASAHSRGTLAFSMNMSWNRINPQLSIADITVPAIYMFWRAEGSEDWNAFGSVNDSKFEYNNTKMDSATLLNLNLTLSPFEIPPSEPWTFYWSALRAFDKLDFEGIENHIEYAILVKKFDNGGNPVNQGQYASEGLFWIQTDDLHYHKCIPRMGLNAANEEATSGGLLFPGRNPEGSYTFNRSIGSNDLNTATSQEPEYPVYAETPYVEYVNAFYEDPELTTIWAPAELEQIINFEWTGDLGGDDATNAYEWFDFPAYEGGGSSLDTVIPRGVAEYDTNTGIKFKPTTDGRLSAKQSTKWDNTVPSSPLDIWGTTRLQFNRDWPTP
jgi:hypothetical protein